MIIYILYDPEDRFNLENDYRNDGNNKLVMESHEISSELHLLLPMIKINNRTFYHLENINISRPFLINEFKRKMLIENVEETSSSPSLPTRISLLNSPNLISSLPSHSSISSFLQSKKRGENGETNNPIQNDYEKIESLIMNYLSFWLPRKESHFPLQTEKLFKKGKNENIKLKNGKEINQKNNLNTNENKNKNKNISQYFNGKSFKNQF